MDITENPDQVGRVLRRYDRSTKQPMRFVTYNISLKSVPFEMNGTTALTLFFPVGKELAADRACKLGWVDETEEWRKSLDPNYSPETTTVNLSELDWVELKKFASDRGISASGKRPEIEQRILDWIKLQ